MKRIVALLALAVALPAAARERISPSGNVTRAGDDESEAAPAPAAEAPTASAAAGVVELSSLAPRPPVEPARGSLREPPSNSLGAVLLALAWRLGLFVLVGYAIFRLIRAWRDAYRFAPPPGDAPSSGLRRSR